MPLFITSLNSGSNGNCYFVGSREEAVLVDVGISCREVEKRMARLGLQMDTIKAIFISHEHSDHIRGLSVLSKKYRLPVYITNTTHKSSGIVLNNEYVKSFSTDKSVAIGELVITAFSKHHDASDPHSFMVESDGIRVGIFTDIGMPCEQLTHHFKQCHAAFLEANYDEGMLENGAYPWYLKERIRNGKGHLSNREALELFITHRQTGMSHLILSHLSRNNNCPDLVRELFTKHAGDTTIVVASRFEETAVYCIGNNMPVQKTQDGVLQLSLFETA